MTNQRFDYSGRTALVTGAAQGIGLELARNFAVADQDSDRLKAEWGERSDTVPPLRLDVADNDAVAAAVEEIVGWAGDVDITANNAGITPDTVIWKVTPDRLHQVIGVHLHGAYQVTRAAVPRAGAARHSRIINVTSYTGLHGIVGQTNYAAAKAGVVGFTKATAKEVARFGITVNAIYLSARTAMVDAMPAEQLDAVERSIPAGRFAGPGKIGATVAFLASDEAGNTTGAVVPVDGGLSM